jgi:succinate dehydrogenase/fumarate reductase-like Fe-S protein
MRVHMYAACYNNFELARQTIDELPPARSLTACRSCGACRAACPAAIDTGKRLDDLRAIFA